VPAQPVDATPSAINLFSKGGVYEASETGEAFREPEDRHVGTAVPLLGTDLEIRFLPCPQNGVVRGFESVSFKRADDGMVSGSCGLSVPEPPRFSCWNTAVRTESYLNA
jgi:hypothetical protein